jgi:glycosyltransferase involved in cell wall biosynthesis
MGVGTRLKILEALGAGLPVVATTIGAEGIEAKDGVDLLIADSADDFADRCVSLLQDAGLRERLAAAGKLLIKEKYDVSTMSEKVLRCYDPG